MRIAGLLTLFFAVTIGIGTLTPMDAPSPSHFPSDKLLHALAFAALVLPLTWVNPWHAVWLVPFALIYGGMIELIQPHVDRSAEWADLLADAIGIATGLLPGLLRARRRFARA